MITKLEQVKTAAELISLISWQGIPTDTESICKMQDIIGHSTEGELIALAQDDGLERRDGSTRSTGRRGTQKEMMLLLFTIWDWERATRFYNQHVNPEYRMMKDAEAQAAIWKERAEKQEAAAVYNMEHWGEADERADKAEKELKEAQAEIMRLKAMLFDNMVKTA